MLEEDGPLTEERTAEIGIQVLSALGRTGTVLVRNRDVLAWPEVAVTGIG